VFNIQLFIPRNFIDPPLPTALGYNEILAFLMPMPETAMHKNNRFKLWENDVRLTGQSPIMQFVSEAFPK
jgi:hypothetical protein